EYSIRQQYVRVLSPRNRSALVFVLAEEQRQRHVCRSARVRRGRESVAQLRRVAAQECGADKVVLPSKWCVVVRRAYGNDGQRQLCLRSISSSALSSAAGRMDVRSRLALGALDDGGSALCRGSSRCSVVADAAARS